MPATEVGTCQCPLCKTPDAIVKKGEKGKHQINCDGCGSLIRTMTRAGDAAILALMGPAKPAPVPEPELKKEPVAAPKKKGGLFADLVGGA